MTRPAPKDGTDGHVDPTQVPDRLRRDRGGRAGRRRRHGRLARDRRPGQADPLPADANVLVLVTLYGGNDGLGTVIPYADAAYHDARPDLAYDADEVLALDDQLGLNPAMKGFKSLWDAKRLAIVRGVGYPKPDRSHFRSMDIWQSGSPDHPANTGWIGRWLDATGRDPRRAVSVGPILPPLAVGTKAAGVALPLTEFAAPTGPIGAGVKQLAAADPADPPSQAMAARATGTLLSATAAFGAAVGRGQRVVRRRGRRPEDAGRLGRRAGRAGPAARARRPLRQGRRPDPGLRGQPRRLRHPRRREGHPVPAARRARLRGDRVPRRHGLRPRGSKVVVAIYSEFGRRVAANASQGTDHGTAGPLLVAGHPVRGGFYGDQPSLTALDDGDLKVTTDFRSVYGTLLEQVLDTEAGRVLDGTRPTLDFL